ncbi:MarR family transcriptional regulator [Thalassomonas viridans]|uniref:MarR family transcriptional regulator n=1 Tax=Thalassomonas viridans TaxID=137584 RepID=A0AAE9Z6R4_9GAMM|nr:helix-turn-helix domain-containing protein [Thalassomonas viridans]WDE07267.1 MarR family transcriptional regulator [Thalassomonas viridans]
MKENRSYISAQIQRTLNIIKVMAGKEVEGISPSEITLYTNISASNVTRTLANLAEQKFVERLPSNEKRWRLSAGLVQISNTVALNLNKAQQQLQQDQHNYSRLSV